MSRPTDADVPGGSDGHGHSHAAASRGRLLVALGITVVILAAEIVGAVLSGSLALLADAGHMLTDSAGLAIAAIAAHLTTRPPSARRTWGLLRIEVLAAAVQATLLLVVGVLILVEAARRLVDPSPIAPGPVLWFGVVGLVGNVISLLVLSGGHDEKAGQRSMNVRAATLEVTVDALGSVAVILGAIVIATTGFVRADALVSILIAVLILPRTLRLLHETANVLLESTPRGLDLDDVRRHILEMPHVLAVHDLHASLIATGTPVLSAHVTVEDDCLRDGHASEILEQLQACVATHFEVGISHSTFQIEGPSHEDTGEPHD